MKFFLFSFLLLLATFFPTDSKAHHRFHSRKHHHVFTTHERRVLTKNKRHMQKACLVRALLNESVGVKSHRARVEVARVLINRMLDPHFPHTLCGVYYQTHHYAHHRKCEFSDVCFHYKKTPFRPKDYIVADMIASEAVSYTYAHGPGKYLYFSSNGKCPVPYQSKMTIRPFVFCQPRFLHES